uniref:Flagellar MS-ring protein n=1 Tax=Macrostomum lignano TaxID=282301 RepID=A0A1I8FHI6_9PLAT
THETPQAEQRATEAERQVAKLQSEVDRLEAHQSGIIVLQELDQFGYNATGAIDTQPIKAVEQTEFAQHTVDAELGGLLLLLLLLLLFLCIRA